MYVSAVRDRSVVEYGLSLSLGSQFPQPRDHPAVERGGLYFKVLNPRHLLTQLERGWPVNLKLHWAVKTSPM